MAGGYREKSLLTEGVSELRWESRVAERAGEAEVGVNVEDMICIFGVMKKYRDLVFPRNYILYCTCAGSHLFIPRTGMGEEGAGGGERG